MKSYKCLTGKSIACNYQTLKSCPNALIYNFNLEIKWVTSLATSHRLDTSGNWIHVAWATEGVMVS